MLKRVLPALFVALCLAVVSSGASSDSSSTSNGPPIAASELRPFGMPDGHGSIKGHVEIRDSPASAETVTVGGTRVYLVPAIPYTKWFFMDYLTGELKHLHGVVNRKVNRPRLTFEHFADSVMRYTLENTTDDQGRFGFVQLPTGNYYVVAFPNADLTRHYSDGDSGYTYEHFAFALLADEPPLSIDGGSTNPTNVTRFVPSERARAECGVGNYKKACDEALDLDQFLGTHDY